MGKTSNDPSNGETNMAYETQEEQLDLEDPYYSTTDEPCSSHRDSCSPIETKVNHSSRRVHHEPMMMDDWGSFRNPNMPRRPAIVVRAGKKSYGNHQVLDNLNMTVPEKSIYGLVGSSGCGKTTLLSCIVGLRQLTSGSIFVCGEVPGSPASGVPGKRIGFMPQEVALNGEFTVREVCHYFGKIYGMERTEVEDRIHYLVDLLDLKRFRGQLKDLSGGQQRRVSFVIALLHEPEILILDEPTVGVDPILRQKMWKHLREIVDNTGTTVIITTHYIEEMRHADTVAIMRKGELMTEDSPTKLLEEHKTDLLENIVLKYCARITPSGKLTSKSMKQAFPDPMAERQHEMKQQASLLNYNDWRYGPPLRSRKPEDIQTKSLNRVKALVHKNAMVMIRSFLVTLFTFAYPSICVALFCYCIGSEPVDLELGVINRDVPEGYVCKPGFDTCLPDNLSCRFLDILDGDSIKLVPLRDEAEAAIKIDERKIWGYIEFPDGYSDSLIAKTLSYTPPSSLNQTFDSQIRIKLDAASHQVGLTMQKLVIDTHTIFLKNLLAACEVESSGQEFPVNFNEPYYGSEDDANTNFIAPGVAIGLLFFMASLTCGLTYIIEKKDGMLSRTMVAGVTTMEIMMSHMVTQLVVVIVQSVIVFFILFMVFDIPRLGSPVLAFALIILTSIAGMSLGFVGAAVCDDEKNAMVVAIAAILPNFLLSGEIWPIEGLPIPMQYVSYALPLTIPNEAFRSILLRGWGMSSFTVWIGFLAATGWIIFLWIAVVVLHKFRAARS